MRRCAGLLGVLAVWAAAAVPAAAQDGAGLYEPFPEPTAPDVSRQFVRDLPAPGRALATELSEEELERGTRVEAEDLPAGFALPAAAASEAAERAEPPPGSGTGWLGAFAVVAAAVVGAGRLARR